MFFSFFQNFHFLGCEEGHETKTGTKWEEILSVSHSMPQEPSIIWPSLMVHMCKRIIYPGVFFFIFFQILIFRVNLGVKGKKNGQKWHMCKRIIPPADFFHFFKNLIFLVFRGGGVHLFFINNPFLMLALKIV